ncbi:MAG TPA: class I SAM-dependent methyltransferase [Polyangiaceae bacterium]|jgi:SAM-dependent methyltransferase|nr:class I SAM-dependent methyltransferase [Polyangiaceae bacterium]
MASTSGRRAARRPSRPKRRKPQLTAKTADKHVLYQKSVQDADTEAAFIERVFRKIRGRAPESLREDFCGTALLTSKWVQRGPKRTGVGVDIDPKVLEWGKAHNISPIGEAGNKIKLYCQDVRKPVRERVDVVGAFNFSYWVFTTRDEMRAYFAHVKRGLGKEGIFLLDAYGGWESEEPMLEERAIAGGFTYVWDQHSFDPITHRVVNYIHFHFRDGTKLERAFTYDWRYWTLPELKELLLEAGYRDVQVYWDTSDNDETEAYKVCRTAENQPGWLAYLVAIP